mgnify:CR=1 FL=1
MSYRERDLVLTMPDEKGRRGWPNDISHLIPAFLCNFDFPDLVAALAPRPVICTEGGLDRDLNLVKRAYELAGHPENFTFYHYKALQDSTKRKNLTTLPEVWMERHISSWSMYSRKIIISSRNTLFPGSKNYWRKITSK